LLAHPHNDIFERMVKDSNIQSMTELVAKVLNEKTLKTKETFIHKLNQTKLEIDPLNAKLVKTMLKSKDMALFKPSAWSKGLDILHSWVVKSVENVQSSPENVTKAIEPK